ncbi:uncharacterized protein HfgLR_14945 [Haloferax gibbonsii]|uniref:Uncharacterized protein n=1 Tax=Haloferax gibbonsii TaxID=35746 RepID=A0A871BIZ4_HALGI|nr:uncharacterized protein HfgLR_14945 [Haloferax gibbonsii]
MDCHDVAAAIDWPVDGASKVLGDIHRAGYVERRDAKKRASVDFEYQLKPSVTVQ